MFSQEQNTQRCALCNSTDFYIEAGFYFCSKCQTQNEDIREGVHEIRYDTTTRQRKIKLRVEKTEKDVIGWTSWELYNFVLIGMTNELIQIGADPNIKLTTLQLWTMYLSKLEVAFTSKTKKVVPKMARRYHKKDAEIIYGKIQQKKKQRRRRNSSNASGSSAITSYTSDGSASKRELNKNKKLLEASEYDSYLQTQTSSDTDGLSSLNQSLYSLKSSVSSASSTGAKLRFNKKAKLESKRIKKMSIKISRAKRKQYQKKHITTKYATGPDIVTPLKLLAIVYLALRLHNQEIYITDILRFTREGHLSYYKLDHLLPPEISLTKTDVNLLTQVTDITHKGFRRTAATVAKFLNVNEMAKPNFLNLIRRYCEDLELPKGISLYAERLYLSSPSVMKFTEKCSLIPNYEGRAMAYIIVVLKVFFSLDDITEKEICRVVEKINRIAKVKEILADELFSFCKWQRYIECRKSILTNLHFPSKIKYDPECIGTAHLYLRFMGLMKTKRDGEEPEITNYKHVLPKNLATALQQCMDRLHDDSALMKEMEVFNPSFTPLRSYITQLLANPLCIVPDILKTNFYETKIGYMTKSDLLVELAAQCGIELQTVNHSLHYLEKIVPPFEQARMPSLKELSENVTVKTPTTIKNTNSKRTENLLDYTYRNRACKLKVNSESFKAYFSICDKSNDLESSDSEDDGSFDCVLPDGRLNIPDDSDSENESSVIQIKEQQIDLTDDIPSLNEEFLKNCNIKLYNHEIEALQGIKKPLKEKYTPYRDSTGKFVKLSAVKKSKKKEFKRIIKRPSESSDDDVTPKNVSQNRNKSRIIDESISEQDIVEVPIDCFSLPDSEITILKDLGNSTMETSIEDVFLTDKEIFSRPFKEYWMYHCIFSRVKGKNFELFEKELPENFLWLLNECASTVEMTSEDLYEEVCLIEAYHLNIKSKKSKTDSEYEFHDCKSKLYSTNTLKKW